MFLYDVLPAYIDGKKIRRAKWGEGHYIQADQEKRLFRVNMEDAADNDKRFERVCVGLHNNDWEIMEDKPSEVVRKRVRA